MKETLLILAADHRNHLKKEILHVKNELSEKQLEKLKDFKSIIFEAFKLSLENGAKKDECGFLMDEDYGDKSLKLAKESGIIIILPVEKSGMKTFEFEYGKNFIQHIEKYNPEYVKVLIHYNHDNIEGNEKTLKNLRILNNYLVNTNHKFLLEMLVDPTQEQLKKYGKSNFDTKVRPVLTAMSIHEINRAGVNPYIWKLEGYDRKEDIDKISNAVNGDSKIVILGRSESMDKVLKWIQIGKQNDKVIGFAVGRTIFMKPLVDYNSKKISREKAVKDISRNYLKIIDYYKNSK